MRNLSDKLIDSQGDVGTYSSGSDSRLFYIDVNGIAKKYLIDGEGGGGVPSSLTFGMAEIFSDSDEKFHIKFNCPNPGGDGYLDLCFYVHTNYDGGKEARCELSYNKMEYPEDEDPYIDTKYIFRGGYNETGNNTYFTTNDFEEDIADDDEYEDCPECGEHTYRDGHCENCGYDEVQGPGDDEGGGIEYEDCPSSGEHTLRSGMCENCGYDSSSDNPNDGPGEEIGGDDEYEDCPSCGQHTLHYGSCENCGYPSEGPDDGDGEPID